MGMLKSISLENYKCFKDKTDIEIKPLTVLCGVNSSGKSSILKSLLILKQSYESSSNINSVALNGIYTNNGYLGNVINHKNAPLVLTNSFSIEKSTYMTSQEKLAIRDLDNVYNSHGELISANINVSVTLKNQNRKNLAYGDNIIDSIYIEITSNVCSKTTIEFKLIEDLRYNIKISGLPSITSNTVSLINTTCHFDGLKIVNLYFDNVEPQQNVSKLLSDIFTISRIVSHQYKDINYISPLRNAPQRRYVIEHDVESVGIYGETVSQILEKYKTKAGKINSIPMDDLFTNRYSCIKQNVSESVNAWLEYFGIDKYDISNQEELIRLSIGNFNILDVGFGVSQALPIIVAGITLPYKSSLLLEQPEVHLHPRMQMSMADLLIATSMAHKNVIVETHSDHFINRVSRRMMENEYIRKNSVIYFFNKDSQGNSSYEIIEVDPIRGIITDNKNFFMEFSSETEKILMAGYKNKIR